MIKHGLAIAIGILISWTAIADDKAADIEKEALAKILKEAQISDAKPAPSEENQPVFKAEAKAEAAPKAVSNPWFKLLASLGLIVATLAGLALVYKKWPWAQKVAKRTRMIEVLSQHHIGQRKSLAVVRVAGESVLIGVTDHSINLLKTLSLLEEEQPPLRKFQNTLSQTIQAHEEPQEDFAMKNLKDLVGKKLKGFKEI